jgi:transcription antitermination factor NusG
MTVTLSAYRVPPLQEFRAAKELRQAGHRAYLPTERQGKRKAPVARGYIFATGKPAEAKHVRQRIGDLPRASLIRLYPRRDRGHEAPEPFKAGDRVEIKVGTFASMTGTLTRKRGRRQWLVDISGRQVCAQTTSLIRIDPG